MLLLRMSVAALSAILVVLGAPEAIVLFLFLLCFVLFACASCHDRVYLAGAFFLFLIVSSYQESRNVSSITGAEATWIVTFKKEIHIDGDRLSAVVTAGSAKETLRLFYRIKSEEEKRKLANHLTAGLTCRLNAEAALPNEARNEGEFSYRTYLSTVHTFFILTPKAISLDQCAINSSFLYGPARWRLTALKHIHGEFPQPLSSIAAALLFGDRTSHPEDAEEAYERLGIVHILSISGLHVTLLTGLLFYALIRLGITREKACVLVLSVLPFYALITGASPPVVRACLMTGAVLAAASNNKILTPSSALGAAFLIMVCKNPYSVFQAGFQLSFAVTWALVLCSGRILKRAQHPIKLSLTISMLAQLAALPILMYHFAELSIIAPLSNLIFVPFYSIIMIPLLLTAFFFSFFLSLSLLIGPANDLLKIMDQLASAMADFPFSVLVTGQPDMKTLVISAGIVVLSFLLWEYTGKIQFVFLCCGLFLAGMFLAERLSAQGEVTFLDVGQGDSIFIKLPYEQGTYLIDTGGQLPFKKKAWMERKRSYSVGKDKVVPFLKRKGVTKLDKLILTHADLDHAGAALEVLESIPAEEIVISPGSGNVDVIKKIINAGMPVREGREGENWTSGNAFFQFVSPAGREYEGNNDSLVLYAELGGKTWLFTGDLEKAGEEQFQEKYKIDINWLKVGHHGSRSSTSMGFVQAIQPEYAVISAGINNRYGHPHKEVLQTLDAAGVRVYRTDKHGSISYIFKGEDGFISTAIQPN